MVQVEIALYDLLPPGKLSTTFYYLGIGIYHTSIRIPELQVELAYGGVLPGSQADRDVSKLTGIFVLPSPDDYRVTERLMPGLRFIKRIDMGEAFGDDWVKMFKGQEVPCTQHSIHKPLPPLPSRRRPRYKNKLSSSSSSGNVPLLEQNDGFGQMEDQSFASTATTDEWGRKLSSRPEVSPVATTRTAPDFVMASPISYDGASRLPFRETTITEGSSAPPLSAESTFYDNPLDSLRNTVGSSMPSGQSRTHELAHILSLVESMKTEPEWRATRYHLLAKNCNSFTNELCYRLTGRHAPSFINRAAWLAQSLPCLVPEGWLDPPTAEELQKTGATSHAPERRGSGEVDRPTSPLIAVPYMETSPMHVGIQYEGVQAGH